MPRGKIVSPGLATLLGFKVNDVVTDSMVLEGVERYVKARASFTIGIWAGLEPSPCFSNFLARTTFVLESLLEAKNPGQDACFGGFCL